MSQIAIIRYWSCIKKKELQWPWLILFFFAEITNTISNQHHKTTLFYCQITFLTKENTLKCILYTTQVVMKTPLSACCPSDSLTKTMMDMRVADLCNSFLSSPHHISLYKIIKVYIYPFMGLF